MSIWKSPAIIYCCWKSCYGRVNYARYAMTRTMFVLVSKTFPATIAIFCYNSSLCVSISTDEEETCVAFEKHFDEHVNIYKHVACINLIEQSGREDIIGQAFMKQILKFNSPKITYITFDFHDHWWVISILFVIVII